MTDFEQAVHLVNCSFKIEFFSHLTGIFSASNIMADKLLLRGLAVFFLILDYFNVFNFLYCPVQAHFGVLCSVLILAHR